MSFMVKYYSQVIGRRDDAQLDPRPAIPKWQLHFCISQNI